MRILVMILALLFENHVAFSVTNPDKEETLIREVLTHYIEGTANGEPERLSIAFHPDFNLYSTTKENDLRIWKGEDYINGITPGKKNSRKGRIISIDRAGITATAKVEIVVPGWRVFTDYFLLVKYQGDWKIVHKSYSSRPFLESDKIALKNAELDSIFSEFNRPDHPAITALAIHKGEIVYKKAFGSANLESTTPATTQTSFQLSHLSKHFTAFATLLLEEQGKLSLQDDIRKYLPSLPAYENTITIDHLLTMTSGLPDIWTMKEMSGIQPEDAWTQEQVMGIIHNLKPAFAPGEDVINGYTDQVLLAEIIARVTGMSFAKYMQEAIFQPLDMDQTVIAEDHNTLIPNKASLYEPDESGFKASDVNVDVVGPINVYSCVDDLAKWELNLLNPKVGSVNLIEKMHTPCVRNDGKTMDFSYGQFAYAQQFYYFGHGVKEIYRMGYLGGHASAMFKFPDQEFTVITLSSGMSYSGYLGMGLANYFIGDQFNDPEPIDFKKLQATTLAQEELEEHTGFYWNERASFSSKIILRNDTLRYMRGNGRESALIPITENRFQMVTEYNNKAFIVFDDSQDEDLMRFEYENAAPLIFKKKSKQVYSNKQLDKLTGRFYCKALNVVYELKREKNELVASHPRVRNITLTPAMKYVFEVNQQFLGSIEFDKDRNGFSINSEKVRGLRFKRM